MRIMKGHGNERAAFTLIELLVVIAIVAALAAVVIVTLNPAELMRQARDTRRMSDFATLHKALAFLEAESAGLASMGSTSTLSVSIPDTSGTCDNLGLPALPSGWAYRCVTSANLRNVDGTGWLPADFASLGGRSPLATLPVDPVNTTSSGQYYTYAVGSWKLSTTLEATKNLARMRGDQGVDAMRFEMGTDRSLAVGQHGLVAYYGFDEGTGTAVNDLVTGSNAGSFANGTTWTTSQLGTAARLDGVNDSISITNTTGSLKRTTPFTVSMWVRPETLSNTMTVLSGGINYSFMVTWNLGLGFSVYGFNGTPTSIYTGGSQVALGERFLLTGVWDGSSLLYYKNGTLLGTAAFSGPIHSGAVNTVDMTSTTGIVEVDELRLYGRALGATEVNQLYEATR